jgi:regulator of sigma E protease
MDIIINFIQNIGHVLFIYLIPLVIVLGIMIFFHELGHFLAAKLFNVKVLKFALGFGPKIVAKEYGETEYSIRYLPLGGFVKMLGEDDFGEDAPPVDEKDINRAFNHQHPFKRIAIVAAGPVFNLVLAFFLFFGLYIFSGSPSFLPESGFEIREVNDDSPAARAGLLKGDILISVGDKKVEKLDDLRQFIQGKSGIPVIITVRRADEYLSFSVTPEESVFQNESGEEVKETRIGITISNAGKVVYSKVGISEAFKTALSDTWKWIKLTGMVVVKLFQGEVSIKTVGGPIMIGQMTGELVQEGVHYLIPFMAIISINLGMLNLFPIPILDGGVILFLLIELVLRRPVSMNKREFAQKVGFSILLILMAVVFYNDILRLFTK